MIFILLIFGIDLLRTTTTFDNNFASGIGEGKPDQPITM